MKLWPEFGPECLTCSILARQWITRIGLDYSQDSAAFYHRPMPDGKLPAIQAVASPGRHKFAPPEISHVNLAPPSMRFIYKKLDFCKFHWGGACAVTAVVILVTSATTSVSPCLYLPLHFWVPSDPRAAGVQGQLAHKKLPPP